MALNDMKATTEHTVLVEWALAERYEWERYASSGLLAKDPDRLSEDDERELIDTFLRIERRKNEVTFMREKLVNMSWYSAQLEPHALGDVVMHVHWGRNVPEKEHWAPPYRTVRDFAAHPSASVDGFAFDAARDPRGRRPILAATRPAGPFHLVEGSHRSIAIWKAFSNGVSGYDRPVRVLVGLHAHIASWGIVI